MKITITPGEISLQELNEILRNNEVTLALSPDAHTAIQNSENVVTKILSEDRTVYGINTGFGLLATQRIQKHELLDLQRSLVLSHAAGTGELLDEKTVRLIMALKINSLARGFSGVRLATIEALITLFNKQIYPCIPSQGSVGASGDLAPLAHLSCLLLGVGDAFVKSKKVSAEEALKTAGLKPLELAPKEGLALLNGTQVSTAIALHALFITKNIFNAALHAGAMTVDATLSSTTPFDERIQAVRGQKGQITVAKKLKELLQGSDILKSHHNCSKIQDPYSLRCQPQVMGACLTQINFVEEILLIEANAVSDNPLVFANENEIISGGNFHAEPVAMAADNLALSIAEIGSISERRIAVLMDPNFSSLPAFLVKNAGVNSGFMIAQVTAAALASENKCLAHPASVDTIPTSANQEDHVSMATHAAMRLLRMAENTATIIAIELLAACQGFDFRRPLKSSAPLEKVFEQVRDKIAFYEKDRFFAPDIAAAKAIVMNQFI
jgi:histidine ammonia-lyase